jgi:hypothetical protein
VGPVIPRWFQLIAVCPFEQEDALSMMLSGVPLVPFDPLAL